METNCFGKLSFLQQKFDHGYRLLLGKCKTIIHQVCSSSDFKSTNLFSLYFSFSFWGILLQMGLPVTHGRKWKKIKVTFDSSCFFIPLNWWSSKFTVSLGCVHMVHLTIITLIRSALLSYLG